MLMPLLYAICGLVICLLVIGAVLAVFAPKEAIVERSIVVEAPQEQVFEYLRSLKNFAVWSPWQKRDPHMKQGFRGTDGQVGSVHWWEGNRVVGQGEQELTSLDPNSKIGFQLRFLKPFKATNDAWLKLSVAGDQKTEVSWGFHADFKRPLNVFMLFQNLDKAIGGDYEQGLAEMKQRVESAGA